jgi:hypothetical protein
MIRVPSFRSLAGGGPTSLSLRLGSEKNSQRISNSIHTVSIRLWLMLVVPLCGDCSVIFCPSWMLELDWNLAVAQRCRDQISQVRSIKARHKSREDVHGVMRSQAQQGFKDDKQAAKYSQPIGNLDKRL